MRKIRDVALDPIHISKDKIIVILSDLAFLDPVIKSFFFFSLS